MVNYPKAIKQLKKTLGLGDDALAKRLGVSGNAVWNWKTGKVKPSGQNRDKVNAELISNNIISEADTNNNGAEMQAEEKPAGKKRGRKPGSRNKSVTGKKRGRRPKNQTADSTISADKNLLKTYYSQLAAQKKISKFHVEIQGINKTHSKDVSPETWAEIMMLLEDF